MSENFTAKPKRASREEIYSMSQWIAKNNVQRLRQEIESRGKDFYGSKPLFFAASENSLLTLEYLKEIGFSPGIKDSNQNSLHYYACRDRGEADVVRYLLDHDVQPEPKDILQAACNGKIEILKLYQEYGIDLRDPNLRDGHYSLMEIAVFSGLEVVKFLFEQGLSLEDRLLPDAANLGKLDLVRYLVLERNADPNRIALKQNAVHAACVGPSHHNPSDHLEILKFLHKHGGDLNAPSDWRAGYTPLHFACMPGPQDKLPIIVYLLENGAKLDLAAPDSALSIADTKTRKAVLKHLEKTGKPVLKDPFERSFKIDPMIEFAKNALKKFALENPNALICQFVIEGAIMSMNDEFDPEYVVADWKYEGFAEFDESSGFDFPLWKEHYDSMGDENSEYTIAMKEVIEGLHRTNAFDCLNRAANFETKTIDHSY
ncbi:ankyrin repeat domain-containing protein [Leptospira gomenensis]|uniref:Ankyrin repeat domain-containing protein n=1 Tax=Leptospira gomenensis TaxID=2484974 RepID=A0A5F1YD74_9LEPT|nr:ankyrin repeat domain-containing protein [Leptospira gomenensis]TGK36015.1 ankyrin repeat domain-containing protein [Leptospira gomenensis]TGK44453.1 ankyrin repeat domain-containing protein [Leptospira gomenensis]TGK53381.1 ankyrin repeat domain-containing protein [Leptospira gomenensis]TGK60684.1 ankyrin repeat domain-containing protein [Leptospira gomenensis]